MPGGGWRHRHDGACWCCQLLLCAFLWVLVNAYVTASNRLCVPGETLLHPKRATQGLYTQHRLCLAIIHGTNIYWAPSVCQVLRWTLDISKPLGMVSSNGVYLSGEVPYALLKECHPILPRGLGSIECQSSTSLLVPPPHVPVTQAGQPRFLRAPCV